MKKLLMSLPRKINALIPMKVRSFYMPAVNSVRKLKYYILPVYLLEGKEKTSGNHLKIAYLGWGTKISSYWTERLFDGKYTRNRKRFELVWNVHRYLQKNKNCYDLAIVEMNNATREIARSGTGFLLPRWFMMQIDTEEFMEKMKGHDVLRRIRKYSLTFEERNTIEDFKFFYHRMYLPYIGQRHKESAILLDYKYFLNKFQNKGGDLVYILKDGKPLAGSLSEYIGTRIRMSGIGILDGRIDIMKLGVVGAAYYYRMSNYHKNGIKLVNIGGTSPITADGLTQFKLSLGSKAEEIKYFDFETLWFIPLKNSTVTEYILKTNPFIHRIGNELYCAIFIDPSEYEDKKIFLKYLNRVNCGNIKETRIFCMGDTEKIDEWIREEEYQNISVRKHTWN